MARSTPSSKTQLTIRSFDTGKAVGELAVPAYLSLEVSPRLIAQSVHVERARTRIRRAHTKIRSEVRGGGRKPWKQKGTGRARAGSSRSPLWVGGGTTFGPRSRHAHQPRLSVSMRRRAFAGALGIHAQRGSLEVVRFGETLPKKTRDVRSQFSTGSPLLILTDVVYPSLVRVARNFSSVRVLPLSQATAADVLAAARVWVDEQGLTSLEQRCRARSSASVVS